ncbi:MAG: nucleotidyltransferase [Luteolibacter sp.]
MNSDFKELLRIFAEQHVEYLIVGAYAVIHYTQPRYTKDIDLWIKPSKENAARVAKAFYQFGLPLVEVTQDDFAHEGLQYVVGVSPCQIDFLTSLPGFANFDSAWKSAEIASVDGIPIHYLGKSDLIHAKQTAGRLQDLADIDELRRASEL